MPDDRTIDFVVMFIMIGLLLLGLGSWLIGWLVRMWDRVRASVNHSQVVMSRSETDEVRTGQTNDRTNERSRHTDLWQAFLLDRTRARLIAVMAEEDLTVTDIRNLLKGESKAIGEEVEAARRRLGKPPSTPYRTPIAGRPTDPHYYQDDPELAYKPLE